MPVTYDPVAGPHALGNMTFKGVFFQFREVPQF